MFALSAEADTCHVRMTWAATVPRATVFRRTVGSDWLPLGQVETNANAQIVFDDTLVTPGVRYAYRIGAFDAAGNWRDSTTVLVTP